MRNSFAPSRLFRVFSDCQQYFFGRESLFCPFFYFYTGKICFSRQYYLGVFGFLRVFFFSRALFLFYHPQKQGIFQGIFFFSRDLFEPTPVADIPPDTRVKKKYSAGILRKRTRPWAPYYPLHQYSILLTCFLILKVNMHAVLSPGTLPRPSMEIGLLEAKLMWRRH